MEVANSLALLDRWLLTNLSIYAEGDDRAAAAAKAPKFDDPNEREKWLMQTADRLAPVVHELLGPASGDRFAEVSATPYFFKNNPDLQRDIAKLRNRLRANLPSVKDDSSGDDGTWTPLTKLKEWHLYFVNDSALRRFVLDHPDKFTTRKPSRQRLDVSVDDWRKWRDTDEAREQMEKTSARTRKPKLPKRSKKPSSLISKNVAIQAAITSAGKK